MPSTMPRMMAWRRFMTAFADRGAVRRPGLPKPSPTVHVSERATTSVLPGRSSESPDGGRPGSCASTARPGPISTYEDSWSCCEQCSANEGGASPAALGVGPDGGARRITEGERRRWGCTPGAFGVLPGARSHRGHARRTWGWVTQRQAPLTASGCDLLTKTTGISVGDPRGECQSESMVWGFSKGKSVSLKVSRARCRKICRECEEVQKQVL